MKKILLSIHSALFSVLCCASVPIKFEKKERVVLVGPTFVERMARFGYLETALILAMPNKEITFRNLGWSADTVKGASRGYEPPQAGYANLLKKVRENNHTLLGPKARNLCPRLPETHRRPQANRSAHRTALSNPSGKLGRSHARPHSPQFRSPSSCYGHRRTCR